MDRKIVYAAVVGVVLYVLGMLLRTMANAEGQSLILFFVTAFIVGAVATGVKRGFGLSLVLAFIFGFTAIIIQAPSVLNDPNIVAGVALQVAIFAVISGALGAVGGFIGRRVFK